MNAYTAPQIAQHKAHKDRTARLWNMKKPEPAKLEYRAVAKPKPIATDDMPPKAKRMRACLEEICEKANVPLNLIILHGGNRDMSKIRQRITFELWEKFKCDFVILGKVMNRDATTVRESMNKFCESSGIDFATLKPPKQKLDATAVEKMRDLYKSGMALTKIVSEFRFSFEEVRKVGLAQGWYKMQVIPPICLKAMKADYENCLSMKDLTSRHSRSARYISRVARENKWRRRVESGEFPAHVMENAKEYLRRNGLGVDNHSIMIAAISIMSSLAEMNDKAGESK